MENTPTNALVKWFGLEKTLAIVSSDAALKQAERELSASLMDVELYAPENITAHGNAVRAVRALITY